MAEKSSFLMYTSWATLLAKLPREQAGELIQAICSFQIGEEYEIQDQAVAAMFAMIRPKMIEDAENYEEVKKQRSESGKAGAQKRWKKDGTAIKSDNKDMAKNGTAIAKDSKAMAKDGTAIKSDSKDMAKMAVSVSDSVSVSESDTESGTDTGSSSKTEDLMFSDENIRRTDVQRVVDAWNALPAPVPKIQKLVTGSPRDKNLKTRIKQYGIDNVLKAIDNIRESPFLLGQKTDFLIRFEWFVKPTNFPKVLDGVYEDHESPQRQQRGRDAPFDPTAYLLDEIEQEGG